MKDMRAGINSINIRESFSKFRLDTDSESYLEGYFRSFERGRRENFSFRVRKDILDADKLTDTIAFVYTSITNKEPVVVKITERRLLESSRNYINSLPEDCFLVVTSCKKGAFTDNDITNWKGLMQSLNERSDILKILFYTQEDLETRLENPSNHEIRQFQDELFYRFFNTSLKMLPANEENALNVLLADFEGQGFTLGKEFKNEMEIYIRTIFPKADLRENLNAFLSDAERRVLREYDKTHVEDDRILDEKCIPFYIRNVEEIKAEALGDEKPLGREIKYIRTFDEAGQEKPKEIKRILILTLSLFSYNALNKNDYVYRKEDGTQGECHGCYQLSPVPLMLIDTGKIPDEIIAIVNKDTSEPYKKSLTYSEEGKEKYRIVNVDSQKGISPLDYFNYEVKQDCKDIYIKTVFHDYDAKKDVNDIAGAAGKILEEIRRHKDAELFVDVHGGLRPQQEVINSVLSLLKIEDRALKPENIFSVEMVRSGENNEKKNLIINAGESVRILDFVSGMNALINYGRADALQDYMKEEDNSPSSNAVIAALNNIATGIQLCNIFRFESGIEALKNALDIYKKDESRQTDYLSLFAEDIEKDYSMLWKNGINPVSEIEWCLKKGYYQQLLTIAEARIPKYLFDKNIFKYDEILPQLLSIKQDSRFEITNEVFNKAFGAYFPKEGRIRLLTVRDNDIPFIMPKSRDFELVDINEEKKLFLALHFGLKGMRNISNHASDEVDPVIQNIELNQLYAAVNRYINSIKQLIKSNETLELVIASDRRITSSLKEALKAMCKNVDADVSEYKDLLPEEESKNIEEFQIQLKQLSYNTRNRNRDIDIFENIPYRSILMKVLMTTIRAADSQKNCTAFNERSDISLQMCREFLRPDRKAKSINKKTGGANYFLARLDGLLSEYIEYYTKDFQS